MKIIKQNKTNLQDWMNFTSYVNDNKDSLLKSLGDIAKNNILFEVLKKEFDNKVDTSDASESYYRDATMFLTMMFKTASVADWIKYLSFLIIYGIDPTTGDSIQFNLHYTSIYNALEVLRLEKFVEDKVNKTCLHIRLGNREQELNMFATVYTMVMLSKDAFLDDELRELCIAPDFNILKFAKHTMPKLKTKIGQLENITLRGQMYLAYEQLERLTKNMERNENRHEINADTFAKIVIEHASMVGVCPICSSRLLSEGNCCNITCNYNKFKEVIEDM